MKVNRDRIKARGQQTISNQVIKQLLVNTTKIDSLYVTVGFS